MRRWADPSRPPRRSDASRTGFSISTARRAELREISPIGDQKRYSERSPRFFGLAATQNHCPICRTFSESVSSHSLHAATVSTATTASPTPLAASTKGAILPASRGTRTLENLPHRVKRASVRPYQRREIPVGRVSKIASSTRWCDPPKTADFPKHAA
jgi:hypothetical protein